MNPVQQHHAQALNFLPNQFPSFFPGFAPQCFNGVNVVNMEVPNVLSRMLMQYIIQNAQGSRLSNAIYTVMQQQEFGNAEFLKLVITANNAFNTCLQYGRDQQYALSTVPKVTVWRWLVSWAQTNHNYLNPTHQEQQTIQSLHQAVQKFEHDLTGAAAQSMPGSVPLNGATSNVGTDLFAPMATAGVTGVTPRHPDFNGGALSSPLLDVPIQEKQQPSPQPVILNETTRTEPMQQQPIQQPVSALALAEEDFEMADVVDVRQSYYVTTPTHTETRNQGTTVDYELHKKARLFDNRRSWGIGATDLDIGDNAIKAIASIADTKVVADDEVDQDVNVGAVGSERVIHRHEMVILPDNRSDSARFELAESMNANTDAVVMCCQHQNYWPTEPSVVEFAKRVLTEAPDDKHQLVLHAAKHLKAGENSDDAMVRSVSFSINNILTKRMFEVMNYELGQEGALDSFAHDAKDVITYVKESVNERSFDHLVRQMTAVILREFKGVSGSFTTISRVCALTRAISEQFAFLVKPNMSYGMVNRSVTPELHRACEALLEYADLVTTENLTIDSVDLYTLDGGHAVIHKPAFGDKFVISRA